MNIEALVQVRAGEVGEGYRILQPDGTATAPITWVDREDEPERVVVRLDDRDVREFPQDQVLSAIWHEDADDVPLSRPEIVGPGVAGVREPGRNGGGGRARRGRSTCATTTSIAQTLAILHHVAVGAGDAGRAAECRRLLSGPPGARPMAQQWLDDPPLDEEKIERAVAAGDKAGELAAMARRLSSG